MISKIINGISQVRSGASQSIFQHQAQSDVAVGANEFLFFVKPELLLHPDEAMVRKVLTMILEKLGQFGLSIVSGRVLSAAYLQKHAIIARHYGVINQLSANARAVMSADACSRFAQLYGRQVADAEVLGSLEFITRFPELSPVALDYLWQNGPMEKLAGGTYVEKLKLDGQEVYLVNGFHPRQLEHFILPGRMIVALQLVGTCSWADARGKLIGATNPANATEGSIRRTLYNQAAEFGLKAVTPSWNGVHLSAGPVEGLVELMRFTTDLEQGEQPDMARFSFGKLLLTRFDSTRCSSVLANSNVTTGGKSISIFDLTEENDATAALNVLQAVTF